MEISRQLIESGSVARPALGVKIVDVTDAQTAQQLGVSTMGVYVVEVTKAAAPRPLVCRPVTVCWLWMIPLSAIPPP